MISDLRVQNFRSYDDSLFEFGEGVNIIVGPNASGKTNLLEAVLVLATGRSYRASDDKLLKFESEWAKLEGTGLRQPRSVRWQYDDDKLEKTYQIGGNKLRRIHSNRAIPAVVFEPNNLQLLTESPESRRNFIDDLIEHSQPGFGSLRRQYKRALSQRNALLKQATSSRDLFVWDVRLSELGGQIAVRRQEFIKENISETQDLYQKLSQHKHSVSLQYTSKCSINNYSSSMLKLLAETGEQDRERGFTSVGPHRDDIVPVLNKQPLMTSGSRGEIRTMLLALKLLEVQTLETARQIKPILLLDDVFSELDGARRKALTKYLQDHQAFITTTDADIVVHHFLDNCTVIPTS